MLDEKVKNHVLAKLRNSDMRQALKGETRPTHEEIERALLTAAGDGTIQTAARAFLIEHTPAVIKGESWAVKLFLELAGVKQAVVEAPETARPEEPERKAIEQPVGGGLREHCEDKSPRGSNVGEAEEA